MICFADINECTVGSNECHDNATCTNTDGNYLCSCNSGFSGDGRNCSSKIVISYFHIFFSLRYSLSKKEKLRVFIWASSRRAWCNVCLALQLQDVLFIYKFICGVYSLKMKWLRSSRCDLQVWNVRI